MGEGAAQGQRGEGRSDQEVMTGPEGGCTVGPSARSSNSCGPPGDGSRAAARRPLPMSPFVLAWAVERLSGLTHGRARRQGRRRAAGADAIGALRR